MISHAPKRVQRCNFHTLLGECAGWIRLKQFGLLVCLTLLFASLTQSGCAGLTNSKGSASADPAPSIITQPASQTVTAGQTATFSVSASGTAPLSYQWKKNGTAISGATSSSYTTPAETTSDSGAQFIVVVSNSAGSETSSGAILTVNAAPPSITTQPTSQTITAGQTATFSVVASGTAPLSYQWQKNGTAITGATSSSYTTPAETTSDSGAQFTVVVSNSAGGATSGAAILTVNAAPALAQTNPLTSGFQPSIDTNCSDSQYAGNIWMTDSMQKVRQDGASPATNACYITIYGTQNEFVDFQVHFHDTGSGTANLNVIPGNFVQSSPASFTISAASTNVITYREAYINVANKTSTAATFYNSTGNYPDILIPAVDPYHSQTTNAWPFTVAAGNNQSAWIDLHIPTNAPSGYYLGSVVVKSGGTTLATMPVILAVWQWPLAGYMPSTATLKSTTGMGFADACLQFFGGYSSCASYPGAGSPDQGVTFSIIDQAMLALDHRYSSSSPIYTSSGSGCTLVGNTDLTTSFGALYSGTASTILSGAKEWVADYGSSNCGVLNNTFAQDWSTVFHTNGWSNILAYYGSVGDEPSDGSWTTIISNASVLHGVSPEIPAMASTNISNATTNSALNAIDIMVPIINDMDVQGGTLQRSSYNSWLAGNCCGAGSPTRQLWSYQSCESSGTCGNGTTGGSQATWPNYDVDGVPAANRVMEWLTFLHAQNGELYYLFTYDWENQSVFPLTASWASGTVTITFSAATIPANIVGGQVQANSITPSGYNGTFTVTAATSNSVSYALASNPGPYSSGGIVYYQNDPWNNTYYFGGNGDGSLIYPSTGNNAGVFTNHVTQSGGGALTNPIFLPSIRLKHIRDGMQDYEYLNVLTNNGQSSLVQTQIASWITNSYTFETSGSGLQAARQALGTAMHQITYPGGENADGPSQPTILSVTVN